MAHLLRLICLVLGVLTAGTAAAEPARNSGAVLVFGGSGQLGSEIVRALLAAGRDTTVFIRPTSDRSRLDGLKVQFLQGDARVDADIERALKSQRFAVVINALGRSESDASFYEISGRSIAHWAQATGVGRVVLHSSVGVGRSGAAYPGGLLPQRSKLFDYKEAAETALRTSGVPYTIIRNAVLHDLPAGATDRARLFADERKFGVVSRRGLARLTIECLDKPSCRNRIFHAVDETMPLD